ncbi:hypothetical protein GIB67_027327 [Kingdonia uniflora]|uniref:UVR domain-containing protein n=1 Tax=Kingdonia uniflora TaxID=39325 RepID=A0A7J7MF94_9MAGN|nr:hypothetical protein GIB67_027327 [Kingdonia uniflora]
MMEVIPQGCGVHNGMYPGTAFTRSMGDNTVEKVGVVVPEVSMVQLIPNHMFFVVTSDGVFEFLSSQAVRNGDIKIQWFKGGITNICYNALDTNIQVGLGDKTAFFWEGNDLGQDVSLTFNQLLNKVCQLANYLKDIGVKKGDVFVIYLPMLMEFPIGMLPCARIGIVHTVVFARFYSQSLSQRIVDCNPKAMITCNDVRREYGTNLSELAEEGKLDLVVGRSKQIEHVIQILCKRTKNNPFLIGKPGVDKTAIAQGVAQRIANGDVPEKLAGKKVIALDMDLLVSSTNHEEFEEWVKKLKEEIKQHDDVILFIDKVDTLIETTAAKWAIDDGALVAAARLSFQYISNCSLPDKAIDLIDEAGSLVQFRNSKLCNNARKLEKQLRQITNEKIEVVHDEGFEKAQELRDKEASLRLQINNLTNEGNKETETSDSGLVVTEADIIQIASSWTGIPLETLDGLKENPNKVMDWC